MADTPAALAQLREAERELLARRPEHAIVPSLERVAALATLLGDPQRAYPVIHVTGTNGKTSTARLTETLLRARGLRTGLFTSPQLSSMRERICVDGEPLSAEDFAAAYDDVAPYAAMVDGQHEVPLSFFELLTGMAFAAFADAPVDVAVIEVGMGGTWDATNIADGAVAVITPIALDHTAYLGDTVGAIAAEKAGIIKPGAAAVLATQPPDAAGPLLRRAAEVGASVVREGEDFGVTGRELAVGGQRLAVRGLAGSYPDLFLPLFGAYQASNAACALAAVEAFFGAVPAPPARGSTASSRGHPRTPDGPEPPGAAGPRDFVTRPGAEVLDEDLVREAFATVTTPGRLEVVRRSPVMIVDSAHNPAGMAVSVAAVTEAFGFGTLVAVLAVSADKDVPGLLAELEPAVSTLVTTQSSASRSMDADELAELAAGVFGPDRVVAAPRLDDAIEAATALTDEAEAEDGPGLGGAGILITGSTTTAGEARTLLGAPGTVSQVAE
jgi:dihydrofolate synthase/folylpolyglutamate synthase